MSHSGEHQRDDEAVPEEIGGVQTHQEHGITEGSINRVRHLLSTKPEDGKGMIDTLIPKSEKHTILSEDARRKMSLALRCENPYGQNVRMVEGATEPKSYVQALLNWKTFFRKGLQRTWKDELASLDETEKKVQTILHKDELGLLQDRWYGAHAFIDGVESLDEMMEESTAKKIWQCRNDWIAMTDIARIVRSA